MRLQIKRGTGPKGVLAGCWLLLALLLAADAGAAVCRVTATAGNGNGGSWSAPMRLQTALASSGCDEIWVAQGSYVPGTTRESSFRIRAGTRVYGGFSGTETSRGQADPAARPTILSGHLGAAGNSYNVVHLDGNSSFNGNPFAAPIGRDTVLDGFTIRDGVADGEFMPYQSGAGLHCAGSRAGSECSPTLRRLRFVNNRTSSDGGAMRLDAWNNGKSSPLIEDVVFEDNHAEWFGGAAMVYAAEGGTSRPEFNRIRFQDNQADMYGGAIYLDGSSGEASPAFKQVDFIANRALQYGGAVQHYGSGGNNRISYEQVLFDGNVGGYAGGAITIDGRKAGTENYIFRDVVFIENSLSNSLSIVTNGGAIEVRVRTGSSLHLDMDGVQFIQNESHIGGGLFALGEGGRLTSEIRNARFIGNAASWDGGAVAVQAKMGAVIDTRLADSLFKDNTTIGSGGVFQGFCERSGTRCPLTVSRVEFNSNQAGSMGGAINLICTNKAVCEPAVANSRFHGNTSGANGGAIELYDVITGSEAMFKAVSFKGNQAGQFGGAVSVFLHQDVAWPLVFDETTFSGNHAEINGGALYVNTTAGLDLDLLDSTLDGNEARRGGVLYGVGAEGEQLASRISNSTLSRNQAEQGGVFYLRGVAAGTSRLELSNVTVHGSSASVDGAVLHGSTATAGRTEADFRNAILWDSSASGGREIVNENGSWSTAFLAYSVVGGGCPAGAGISCGAGMRSGDPQLDGLADNGGSTRTMLILRGSSAIDAGDATTCASAFVGNQDQRGVARPQGTACDIGAVEVMESEKDRLFRDGFEPD